MWQKKQQKKPTKINQSMDGFPTRDREREPLWLIVFQARTEGACFLTEATPQRPIDWCFHSRTWAQVAWLTESIMMVLIMMNKVRRRHALLWETYLQGHSLEDNYAQALQRNKQQLNVFCFFLHWWYTNWLNERLNGVSSFFVFNDSSWSLNLHMYVFTIQQLTHTGLQRNLLCFHWLLLGRKPFTRVLSLLLGVTLVYVV